MTRIPTRQRRGRLPGRRLRIPAKPFDIDQAVELVRRAATQGLLGDDDRRSAAHSEMLGHAPSMQEVFRAIGRLSRSSMTVLITGESARARSSSRARCIATAAGHEAIHRAQHLCVHRRPARVGVVRTRRARSRVGRAAPAASSRPTPARCSSTRSRHVAGAADALAARAGEASSIESAGSCRSRSTCADAATHQNLEDRVRQAVPRGPAASTERDPDRVPPLRNRARHPGAAASLSRRCGHRARRGAKSADERGRAALSFRVAGNVRQLVNACRRLTVIAAGREITAATFRPILRAGAGGGRADWSQALASWAQARFAAGGAPLLEDAMPEFERP